MKEAGPARLLPTHTPELFEAAVAAAVDLLRAGEVVALPTETVYGLAANAFDAAAVARIYEIKGRPAQNPIIVHVAGLEMARRCFEGWPPRGGALARAFWPGPLTLVYSKSAEVPDIVTAGGRTVGVRWPAHPFVQAVIRACGFPLAAPSANRSNELSPTCANHVRAGLGDRVSLIVDGGQCQVGIESTVLDVSAEPPQILRPGMIHEESLMAVTGSLAATTPHAAEILRSPGMLTKHYAPRARLTVLSWTDDAELAAELRRRGADLAGTHVIVHTRIPSGDRFGRVSMIPHDAEAYARAIYAELHRCDELGAEWIVVEALPQTSEWRGIADRLLRGSEPRPA